jgi:tRNA (cytidine/uridine-2'-O-)-methyltransferase
VGRQRIPVDVIAPSSCAMQDEPSPPSDHSSTAAPRLHVVLVEPEIAANTGAIGRTCVAAAATLWLVRPLGFHLDDRHVRRAGLDYWEHLDLRVVDHLDEVALALGRDRLWSFSTRASRSYTEAAFEPGDGLVFGPESRGLPRSWLDDRPDRSLRIPIRPEARSLNLANAVAIALFEGLRQIGPA